MDLRGLMTIARQVPEGEFVVRMDSILFKYNQRTMPFSYEELMTKSPLHIINICEDFMEEVDNQ